MFLTLAKCTAERGSLHNLLLPNTPHGAVCSFPSSPTRPSCLSLGSRFIFELWKSFWRRKNQINICHFPKNNLTSIRGTIRGYINSFMGEKKFVYYSFNHLLIKGRTREILLPDLTNVLSIFGIENIRWVVLLFHCSKSSNPRSPFLLKS